MKTSTISNPTNEEYFKLFDLNLAAVLVAFDYPLDHIERLTSGRVIFFFKSSAGLFKVVQDFWKQELSINPQKLFDSLKFLKNRLYANS